MHLTFSHGIPMLTFIATISSEVISTGTVAVFNKIFFLWSYSNDFNNSEVCTTEAFSVFPHVSLSYPIKNLSLRDRVFGEAFSLSLFGLSVNLKVKT